MIGLNWSSKAFLGRLIWTVQAQERPCRCRNLIEVLSFSGRRAIGQARCARPSGHREPCRLADGRAGRFLAWVPERDPLIEAGEVLRSAEIAVRRTKRSTG